MAFQIDAAFEERENGQASSCHKLISPTTKADLWYLHEKAD